MADQNEPNEATGRTLDDYGLTGLNLAKMTGVSLATHAIPDAFLLQHVGVGCKYKAAAQVAPHDWADHPNRREAWTQVGELQLIKGSSERIGPFARSWYERRRPNLMLVVSAYFIELTGEDFSDAVVATEKTLPCDMVMVKTAAPNGGFFDGYASVVLEALKKMDWKRPQTKRGEAAVVGWFFDRYEQDQQGDLRQLRTLLKVAGLSLGPVLLSGTAYPTLQQAPDSEHLLLLPYMGKKARRVKRTTKRRPIPLDLPIGIAGTTRFLRELVRGTGGDERRVEAWITAQEKAAKRQLDLVRDHIRNVRLAIFADSPYAAGLASLLIEMGIEPTYIGLRDSFLGGKRGFEETLERLGITLPPSTIVLEQPTLARIRTDVYGAIAKGQVSGVIGSSHELCLFDPDRMKADLGTALLPERFLRIETGFPSDNAHATFPVPDIGFTGAIAWSQRILDWLLAGETRNVNVG